MEPNVIWSPYRGSSQELFLSCPYFECLYEGTRGPGKTDSLIFDFAQHVGQGFGEHWRGVLFRQNYPQLADVIARTKQWFHQIFPGADFNKAEHVWTFPDGEELLLRHMDNPDDYWNYHGHQYPWIGWEELTNWPTDSCYEAMQACCRSAHPGMPRKYRSTANPYGVGHNWVKAYFIDLAPRGVPVTNAEGQQRVAIHGSIWENRKLLENDPEYVKKLQSITNENLRKAWLEGCWDIVAGGMFDDVWSESVHVLRPFPIPHSWRIDRSFDWGSSKPFSVQWWAESDGTECDAGIVPRGTLFMIGEWYGWNGKPNEGCKMLAVDVAKGILEREGQMGIAGRVHPGPADSQIFDAENGVCISDDMAKEGVKWERCDKSPGSRKSGWERMRNFLSASAAAYMETPGLFVFNTCRHFIRTFPVLPRDERKPDDIDTNAEDHAADSARYRCMHVRNQAVQKPLQLWKN